MLEGNGTPLNGQILNPTFFGYNPELKPYPYDVEKAKQLLAQAGFASGLKVELDTPQGRYLLDKELAEAVSGQLAKVGVTASVNVMEFGNYMDKYLKEKNLAPLALIGQSWPTLDADGLFGLFESSSPYAYWNNPEFDRLRAEARSTVDQDKRRQLYAQATTLMREEAPVLFLHQQYELYGLNRRSTGSRAGSGRLAYAGEGQLR